MKLRHLRPPARPLMAVGAILAAGFGMIGLMNRRSSAPGPEAVDEPRNLDGPRATAELRDPEGIPPATHPVATESPHMHRPRPTIAGLSSALGLLAIGVACLRSPSSPWAGAALSALLALLTVALIGIACRRGARRAYWQGAAICGFAYLTASLGPWFDAAVRPTLVTTKLIQWAYPRIIPEARQLAHHRPFALTAPVRVKGVDMNTLDRGPLDVRIEVDGKESQQPLARNVEVATAEGDGPVIKNLVLLADREQLAELERARCEGANLVLSRPAAGPFASLLTAPPVAEPDFERVGHALCGIVFALIGGAAGWYFYATNDPASQAG